ncbi:comF family protein [Bacteroides faecichinchillae]|uniref:ComF family protein n=2 Tax=Bacteroides faecichinchillae TaxID=871325 RepID=A0A1M4TKD5_9BACE|nr:comF family protein [Bacteroides faecichinchillae]
MMKHTLLIKDWLGSFLSLLFPRCCLVCGRPLAKGEECICTMCNINLPRTNYHLQEDNPVEQLFWGKVPLERATSFFFYRKGSDFRQILHQLKYGGRKELGATMGRYMASELLPSGFFKGIDVIIPVPLHKKKQQLRGYNQSEWIVRGIAAVTGISVNTESIIRRKNTETQTRKSTFERWENVDGIFELHSSEHLPGKHVLIVDDVLTTGATTVACASALMEVQGIRISILTLAVAE